VDQYTLLKKPMEHLGQQLNVSGSFWQGRMSEDELDKIYKCTIVDFSLAQKVAPNSSPRMVFKVQEMGIDCTGSHENSDLASTMCPGSGERQRWRGGKGHDAHAGMTHSIVAR